MNDVGKLPYLSVALTTCVIRKIVSEIHLLEWNPEVIGLLCLSHVEGSIHSTMLQYLGKVKLVWEDQRIAR